MGDVNEPATRWRRAGREASTPHHGMLAGVDGIVGSSMRVRGDVGRKLNNALTMTFTIGPDEPVATAKQSGGDGRGRKLGVLFGFKNGGPGIHVLTSLGGTAIEVESREQKPTLFRSADGAPLAEAVRGAPSVVSAADGSVVFTVVPAPDGATVPAGARLPDAFRTHLLDAAGSTFGTLDVIRSQGGWSLGAELVDDMIWFGHAGQPLKIPVIGTALTFLRPPTALEGDLALAVCVDMAIGLRPYIPEMD
ncbi:MAG: hypothetical protein JWN46_647 [Acidimicrobiales bacterium]|nr:hypothetical protein [Acidimicrobiales bacterium]